MVSQASKQAPPKDSIGGTAACAILGLSSYNGSYSVWMKIRSALNGTLEEQVEPEGPLLRGLISEDPLLELYGPIFKSETGLTLVELPPEHSVIRHPVNDFIHGTPDRLLMNADGDIVGVLEFKTFDNQHGQFNWSRKDYWTQLTHYSWLYAEKSRRTPLRNFLMVAQGGFGAWSNLVECLQADSPYGRAAAKLSVDWREMQSPEDTIKGYDLDCVPKLISFWINHVASGESPPVDHTEACRDSFSNIKSEPLTLDDALEAELALLVKERNSLKNSCDAFTTHRKLLENQIIQLLDGHQVADGDAFKVSYRTSKGRKGFKQSLFKKDYPNIYSSYIIEGAPSKRLTITEKSNEPS